MSNVSISKSDICFISFYFIFVFCIIVINKSLLVYKKLTIKMYYNKDFIEEENIIAIVNKDESTL